MRAMAVIDDAEPLQLVTGDARDVAGGRVML
jgi:hypothetical protein